MKRFIKQIMVAALILSALTLLRWHDSWIAASIAFVLCLLYLMNMNFNIHRKVDEEVLDHEDMEYLEELAFRFRGNGEPRDYLVREYSKTVERMIRRGTWKDCPGPESQLPDEFMPRTFREFWTRTKS